MSRERLQTDRVGMTHKFNVSGYKGYVTVSLYPDGRPGECFIVMQKEGSTIGGLMDAIAILISVALQHGVTSEKLVEKLGDMRFEPSGTTTNHEIPECSSVVDYVVRWIALESKKRRQIEDLKTEQS